MDASAIVSVSAAVVALTTLVKWAGVKDTWGAWAIIELSMLGVGVWAYSKGPAFDRGLVFDYFSGWIAVATSAAGVFGFTRSMPAAVTEGSRNSTLPGAAQNPTIKPSDTTEERRG